MFYLFLYQHPSLAEGLAAVCSTHARTVGLLGQTQTIFPEGKLKGGPVVVGRQRLADLLIRFDAKTGDRMITDSHRMTTVPNDTECLPVQWKPAFRSENCCHFSSKSLKSLEVSLGQLKVVFPKHAEGKTFWVDRLSLSGQHV